MTGRVADIQRFCLHDGPGIRSIVFLQGCPLCCAYCHNSEMQSEKGGYLMSVEQVLADIERDRPFYEASGGGLTLSGGEPLMQAPFAIELLTAARTCGLNTCVETSGSGSIADIRAIAPYTDLFLWDVKFTDAETTAPIEALHIAENAGSRIWLRSVLLPGADETLLRKRLLAAASGLKSCDYVEILPFNPMIRL